MTFRPEEVPAPADLYGPTPMSRARGAPKYVMATVTT